MLMRVGQVRVTVGCLFVFLFCFFLIHCLQKGWVVKNVHCRLPKVVCVISITWWSAIHHLNDLPTIVLLFF